jgi:hypothetical protein
VEELQGFFNVIASLMARLLVGLMARAAFASAFLEGSNVISKALGYTEGDQRLGKVDRRGNRMEETEMNEIQKLTSGNPVLMVKSAVQNGISDLVAQGTFSSLMLTFLNNIVNQPLKDLEVQSAGKTVVKSAIRTAGNAVGKFPAQSLLQAYATTFDNLLGTGKKRDGDINVGFTFLDALQSNPLTYGNFGTILRDVPVENRNMLPLQKYFGLEYSTFSKMTYPMMNPNGFIKSQAKSQAEQQIDDWFFWIDARSDNDAIIRP